MQLRKPTAANFEHECTQEALRNDHRVEFAYYYGAVIARFYNGQYLIHERRWHMGVVT